MRRLCVAMAAGAASILAMAPFHVAPVLLVTLPLLVWLLDGAAASSVERPSAHRYAIGAGFAVGWGFGFGYHLLGLFWIGEAFLVEADVFAWLLPFAVGGLPAAMAIYWGLAGAATVAAFRWAGPDVGPHWRVVVLALTFGLAEWMRGHMFTGFPWNVLGYALTQPLVLMQSAGVVGIYGLTILTVLVFATPLVLLAERLTVRPISGSDLGRRMVALPLVVIATLTGYGVLRLAPTPTALDGVVIRIVQPSIAQKQKWRPELQRRFFEEHLGLSGGDGDSFTGISHVVWPEASMPFGPLRSPEALGMIAERIPAGVTLIAGALRAGDTIPAGGDRPLAYNSLLAFGGGGGADLAALYDKIHLVPFGEYLPFQSTLERVGLEQLSRMRGGFASGVRPRPLLDIPGLPPVGVLICYEAIFPAAVVQGAKRPGLLVNITNDGWFGDSTGPRQHFHQSRVRAVEEGVSLIRAANNGISGLVDPYGRIIGRLDLDARATLDVRVPRAASAPLYARVGDSVFFLGLAIGTGALAWAARRRLHPSRQNTVDPL